MTKEQFLSGVIFKSTHKRNGCRFINQKAADSLGYLEEKNNLGLWVHYGSILKINSKSATIYSSGIRKIHKEKVCFSDLEINEKQTP